MISEGRVGELPGADGSPQAMRLDPLGSATVADARARYAELCRRGRVFATQTAVVGTTVVAGNVSPIAAAAASVLSVYNPADSGVVLEVIKGWLSFISGTPGVGVWMWNGGPTSTISATANAVAQSQKLSTSPGRAKCFTQTALTGSALQAAIRPFAGSGFGGAIAATTFVNFVDQADGDLVIPQGHVLSIAAPATGTSTVVAAGISWAEMPA